MALKKVKQHHVAAEFGVTQPSVSEWLKYGRIDKKHLPHLLAYFSDVADFAHWGLPSEWGRADAPRDAQAPDAREQRLLAAFRTVLDSDRDALLAQVEARAAYVAELAQQLQVERARPPLTTGLQLAHVTSTDDRDHPIEFRRRKTDQQSGKKIDSNKDHRARRP